MNALAAIPSLNVPTPSFPVIGDQAPVAILFLAHMAIVQFSLGVITLGPIFEILGHRDGDPRKIRLARSLTKAYYLSFSIGATLGVFAVTVLIGVWGNQFGVLVNRFLPLVALAFGIFPVMVPLLVVYHNSFGRMARWPHAALGVAVWFLQTLFLVAIEGVDAYLTNPDHSGFVAPVLNAAYFPLLAHRLVGNVSWAALFVAAVAVIRLRGARTEVEAAFHSWTARVTLRIGTATLLLMPPLGAVILAVFRSSQPAYFDNLVRGDTAWLFIVQAALLGLVFIGANLALATEMPRPRGGLDGPGRLATALSIAGMAVGCLPSAALGEGIYIIRYVGIGVAMAATLVHLLLRTAPRHQRLRLQAAPGAQTVLPFTASARSRQVVAAVGVLAVALSLWMGFIKSEARGQYAIYGEMTQGDAHGQYSPEGLYP